MKLWLLLVVWLAGCANPHREVAEPSSQSPIIYALRTDGRYAVTFDEDYVSIGRREPPSGWGEPRSDCSDEILKCTEARRLVFAVPRRRVRAGYEYAAEGMRFRVVRCLDGGCDRMLIRGDCEVFDQGTCRLGAAAIDNESAGFVTYFVFDRFVGVTAMGFDLERTLDPRAIERLSGEYVLEGEIGILSEDSVTPPKP